MIAYPTTFAEPRNWWDAAPVYRVNFWALAPGGAWGLEAFVLFGASDVTEALAWVQEHRHGRKVELFVEVEGGPVLPEDVPRTSGLIRILGEDPDVGVTVHIGTFVPEESVHN